MKKLEFKPEDFMIVDCRSYSPIICADHAQSQFDQWFKENISEAPVVYGSIFQDGSLFFGTSNDSEDTHTARVVLIELIEPIQAKECEHKNFTHFVELVGPEGCGPDGMRKSREGIRCVECRKELRPKGGWETIDP